MSVVPSVTSSAPVAAARAEPERREDIRLGLALSGGGFRATLFHLGVLTRLAELDLLRHVAVISSVSGGSILAADYMLHLKDALERSPDGRLSQAEYIEMIERIGRDLDRVMQRGLRNEVLLSPTRNLFTGRSSLDEKMARLYQKHLFREATRRLELQDPDAVEHGPRLRDLKIQPGARAPRAAARPEELEVKDIRLFNAHATTIAAPDRIPELVMNSTTLNTASRFTFTFSEIGDEILGYIRFDELGLATRYRELLDQWHTGGELALVERIFPAASGAGAISGVTSGRSGRDAESTSPPNLLAGHLAWWKGPKEAPKPGVASAPEPASDALRHLSRHPELGPRFLDAPLSVLRQAKIAAWFLLTPSIWRPTTEELRRRVPAPDRRRGGFTREEHRRRLWSALREVDQVMVADVHPDAVADAAPGAPEQDWYRLALDLYHFRVAENLEVVDRREVRLPIAVQASANFPPVFAGLHLRGVFDPERIEAVQLSDGGLQDNNGLEALLDARCTHIIASEAGPRPAIKSPIRLGRLGMVAQIMINQLLIVRRLLMRTLREQGRVRSAAASRATQVLGPDSSEELRDLWRRYPVEGVAFFDMESNLSDGESEQKGAALLDPHPFAREIARIRTDLDGFSDVEQQALLYQGYQYCDRFVRRYLYEKLATRLRLPARPPAVTVRWPLPVGSEREHTRRVLFAGRAQTIRSQRIGASAWWPVLGYMIVAAIALLELGHALDVARFGLLGWLESELGRVLPALPLGPALLWLASVAASLITMAVAALLWLLAALELASWWQWLDGRFAMSAARRPVGEREPGGTRDLSP